MGSIRGMLPFWNKQRLSRRFFVLVLLCSFAALMLSTGVEIWLGYRRGVQRVERNLRFVQNSYLPAIETSLYTVDRSQLAVLLKGVINLQGVVYCEVREKAGSREATITAGNVDLIQDDGRPFDLSYVLPTGEKITIGTLVVYTNAAKIHEQLWEIAFVQVAVFSIMIFLSALVVMVLFQKTVARHLFRMADFARGIDLAHLDARLVFQRRPRQDELEDVAGALNAMQAQLVQDITVRKRLESQLQQVQRMEAIGSLAGGIAHDFNNILSPIIGLADLLLDDLPRGSAEHDNVREILNAGIRGRELVKQILTFSRQSEHEMAPVRIQQVLREVLKLGRATIPADIEIVQEIENDCGLVMADATQLHQVAMNLVTNAFHAVEATHGRIAVYLKQIEFGIDAPVGTLLAPGRYALLTVADTGCGMDAGVMSKIFTPYFTTKEKGTGLGLAIVYGIVKNHGGDIKVYSEPGKGSTFNVYLPLMEKDAEALANGGPEKDPSGDERILVVDDEAPVAKLETLVLERLGYRPTTHTSSTEALALFRRSPDAFDLVLSDMAMPNMAGDELARALMAIRSDIPIIICTGFSERINPEFAAALGIKGVLMKPVVKSELARVVRQVLDEAACGRQ